MDNPYSLLGKTILIIGASSGIGRATAVSCANMGANVIIVARNETNLKGTFSMMNGNGHQIIVCDINDKISVIECVNKILKLDGVVYCSGILRTVPTKMIDRKDLDFIYETNFFSIVQFNTFLLQSKKLKKYASLVFISSISAFCLAEVGNAIYSSSKAAISSYARVLALELSRRKIRVNSVAPGIVKTNFLNNVSVDEDQFEQDEKRYPLGYGLPQDVAYAICYLLSPAARWITGTELKIDGGVTLK